MPMQLLDMKPDGPVECQGLFHNGHVGFFRRIRFRSVIFEMLEEEQENSSLSLEVPSEDFVWVIGFGFCELRSR